MIKNSILRLKSAGEQHDFPTCGRSEIRTRGALSGTRSFQDRQLNRSCILPKLILILLSIKFQVEIQSFRVFFII